MDEATETPTPCIQCGAPCAEFWRVCQKCHAFNAKQRAKERKKWLDREKQICAAARCRGSSLLSAERDEQVGGYSHGVRILEDERGNG